MSEKRNNTRHRVLKSGSILLDRNRAFTCIVRNISDTGACIEFAIPLDLPDEFTLLIPSDHVKHSCHVQWRKEKRFGVAFNG
jgi:hypothetical protein